jgi:hypothetical protein
MNIRKLILEAILCLQYAGMTSSQIICQEYEEWEFAERFEHYSDKAEEIGTIIEVNELDKSNYMQELCRLITE